MSYPTKIATCCYCGTRAALVLRGKARHELACSTCGAPLRDMKMLRREHGRDDHFTRQSRVLHWPQTGAYANPKPKKRRKDKGRRVLARFLEDALDVLEDIFDGNPGGKGRSAKLPRPRQVEHRSHCLAQSSNPRAGGFARTPCLGHVLKNGICTENWF